MTQFEKSISNKSYTNKDFGTIYPELLDLAKKLSYKWDPTVSDESDPGVVLIKLAAILADKLNYNIDKNVLELYPVSVTQLANARKLFLDNGYKMQYYQSAVAPLSLHLTSEPEIETADVAKLLPNDSAITPEMIKSSSEYQRTYIVPKYTMFTDTNSSVVYTLTEDVYLTSSMTSAIGNAIQGKIVQLNVGGSTIITADTLKDTKIVRLPDTQVAQNGIFVASVDSGEEWACVDNILVEAPGTRCYEFGISPDGRTCYIEFPDDVLQMIGGGLTVHYIITSGYNGNVSTGYINKFFTDTTINRYINKPENTQAVNVTSDNISIKNKVRTLTGKDPESIESAYRNYKRTRNTFHTLVSTQDYSNFVYTNNDVSNGFVCDRNDDVQSSIRLTKLIGDTETEDILTRNQKSTKQYTGFLVNEGSPTTETATIEVVEETPEMTAFDLRLYGLQYVEAPSESANAFNTSFQPLLYTTTQKSQEWKVLEEDMYDLKCISHNFVEFIPNRLFMIKNRFPIVAKLVSSSQLNLTQRDEILRKAQKTLYDLLNSRVIEFGAEIDYTEVYNALSNCDARINAIMLSEFRYETYAIYVDDNGKIAELRIDANSQEPPKADNCDGTCGVCKNCLWKSFRAEIFARSMLAGTTQPLVRDTTFTYQITQHPVEYSTTIKSTVTTPGGDTPDSPDDGEPGGSNPGGGTSGGDGTGDDGTGEEENPDPDIPGGNDPEDDEEGSDVTPDDPTPPDEENPDKKTPSPGADSHPSVIYPAAEINLNFKESGSGESYHNWWQSSVIGENSTVVLTAPHLISGSPFSSYVKFVHNIGLQRPGIASDIKTKPLRSDLSKTNLKVVVNKDEDYVLDPGEYIIFFWKEEDTETAPYKYKKLVGTSDTPTIICPTRALMLMPNPDPPVSWNTDNGSTIEEVLSALLQDTTPTEGTIESGTLSHKFIAKCLIGNTYDIKTDSIVPKTTNRIQINDDRNRVDEKGRFYWLLNSAIQDEKDSTNSVYKLFAEGETKYTLQNGETLIYTNNSNSELYLLGGGTVIERKTLRSSAKLDAWVCPKPEDNSLDYLREGPVFFKDRWFTVDSNDFQIFATEMEYYILDSGHTIKLTPYKEPITETASKLNYYIVGDGVLHNKDITEPLDLQSYDVSYIDAGRNETHLSGKHHESIRWQIYSQLNVKISPDHELVLGEGESIAGFDRLPDTVDDGVTEGVVRDDVISIGGVPVSTTPSWIIHGSRDNPVHIQSDVSVNVTSNTHVNIEYVDIFTGERKPPSLFVYTSTNETTETVNVGKPYKKVICSPGSYILPVKLTSTDKNHPPQITVTPYRSILLGWLNTSELSRLQTFTREDVPNDVHPSFATIVEAAFNKCHVSLNGIVPETHIRNSMRLISTADEDTENVYSWSFDTTRKTSKYVCKYFGTDCSNANPIKQGGHLIEAGDDGKINIQEVYTILSKNAAPGDVSFIITNIEPYVAIQDNNSTTGYTLYTVGSSISPVDNICLAKNDQVLESVNGFTLRFSDKQVEVENEPVICKTLLQYESETDKQASVASGKYYFCIDIPEGIVYYDIVIGHSIEDADLSTLNVSNLYKYNMATLSSTVDTKFVIDDRVRSLLRELDKDGYFDYVRTPNAAHEVAYPLDPIAFCDENHIFNKCTICQYTPKAERFGDIQVVNKLR